MPPAPNTPSTTNRPIVSPRFGPSVALAAPTNGALEAASV
jgi:hypothetical protein